MKRDYATPNQENGARKTRQRIGGNHPRLTSDGYRGVWGLSMTNRQEPSACRRTTSVLRPRVVFPDSSVGPGSRTQSPCNTARLSSNNTTDLVLRIIRGRRARKPS